MRGDQLNGPTRKHLPGQGQAAAAQDREEVVARRSTHVLLLHRQATNTSYPAHRLIPFAFGVGVPRGAHRTHRKLRHVCNAQPIRKRRCSDWPCTACRFHRLHYAVACLLAKPHQPTPARTKHAQLGLRTTVTSCLRDESRPRNCKHKVLISTWRACAQPQTSNTQGNTSQKTS